jgi:hypothetical protein
MTTPTCEYPECAELAQCSVEAQWTLVDFIAYQACDQHSYLMMEILEHREVDGQLPVDVWIHHWE